MLLIICEKLNVAKSIASALDVTSRATAILKEMGISFPGASGIWWGWQTRPPTMTDIKVVV